jgi:hypothetical protein
MKITKSQLKQLIKEELETFLMEQEFQGDPRLPYGGNVPEEDLHYLSGLQPDMSEEQLALLSLGMDPSLAPNTPAPAPETPETLWKPEGYHSATMEPSWQEIVRAEEARKQQEIQDTENRLLNPEPLGPSPEQVRQELLRRDMERGSR